MCMDAIMTHIMQQMVASGQIEVPTGIPKMGMMIPSGGLEMNTPVPPVDFYIPTTKIYDNSKTKEDREYRIKSS